MSLPQGVPVLAPSRAPCGCVQASGRRITDPERHAAWHARVEQQGVDAPADATALLRARRRRIVGGLDDPDPVLVEDLRAVARDRRVDRDRRP